MSTPARRLPARPSLEQLRKQAKDLLKETRTADPHRSGEASLGHAQFVLAREYGFENWSALVHHVERLRPADVDALGLSTKPPLYRIDWRENTIEPQQPTLSDSDWDAIFRVMKELEITGLRANQRMTDGALARLSGLDHVTRLGLGGANAITDEGVQQLARMPQLQDLDLGGWESPISDRGLEVLRHLPNLTTFHMGWARRVTDAGMAHLAGCDRLEIVNLLGTQTGDGAVRALTNKPRLRRLLAGGHVSAAGLPLLHEFPMFKTWHGGEANYSLMAFEAEPTLLLIAPMPFTHGGLEALVGLDGLFALNVDGPVQMTAEGLAPVAELGNLGWLGVDPTDDAMSHVAAMPRLRMLMCQDTKASDDGFVTLGRSQSIEYIWGRRCYGLQSRGFTALASMPSLRGLSVSCKNVDDSALAALPRSQTLREFMPMDVPDAGFRHVGQCTQLERLWCMYCRDTGDEATSHLTGLSRLKSYYAGSTQITDRSLEILGRLSTLEAITLEYTTGVTNAGIAALAALPSLQEITIDHLTQVTREGAAVFPPRVRVVYHA